MTVRPVTTVELEPSIYASEFSRPSEFSRLGEQIEELMVRAAPGR